VAGLSKAKIQLSRPGSGQQQHQPATTAAAHAAPHPKEPEDSDSKKGAYRDLKLQEHCTIYVLYLPNSEELLVRDVNAWTGFDDELGTTSGIR
jgi:hypothetical protein